MDRRLDPRSPGTWCSSHPSFWDESQDPPSQPDPAVPPSQQGGLGSLLSFVLVSPPIMRGQDPHHTKLRDNVHEALSTAAGTS